MGLVATTSDTLHYRIYALSPPVDDRMGGYGFGIYLEGAFAARCKATKTGDDYAANITRVAKEAVGRIYPNMKFIKPPLKFYEDTALLHFCEVPGDACNLAADHWDIEHVGERDLISYAPHNVDNVHQVYALLTAWLTWYDYILSPVDKTA